MILRPKQTRASVGAEVPSACLWSSTNVSSNMTQSILPVFISACMIVATTTGRSWCQGVQFKAEYEDNDDLVGGIDGLKSVGSLALSPDGISLYAVAASDDSIAAFRRDPATGLLTFVTAYFDDDSGSPHAGEVNFGLNSARDVAVSPDSRHVYATGSLDAAVGIFSRNPATSALTFVEAEVDEVTLAGAYGVVVSPDDAHVYVATRASDSVVSFSRDIATGALTLIDVERNFSGGVTGLDSVEGIAISPDGKHVYTAAGSDLNFSGSNAIGVFARGTQQGSAEFGKLTFVEALVEEGLDGSGNTVDGLNEVSRLIVSPDGRHVYSTTNVEPLDFDWVAVFARDSDTGRLTFVESHPGPPDPFPAVFCSGVISDCGVAVHPDGSVVYAANTNGVGVFARDSATGKLTFSELECGYFGLGVASTDKVVVSADGKHLYTAEFPFGVAMLMTEAPSYEAWAACFPGLTETGQNGDPDGDGLTNLIEFALDLDPTRRDNAVDAGPQPVIDGNRLTFEVVLPFPPRNELLIEIIATSDLAAPEVIASRMGSDAWTGPANVVERDPFNGRTVIVSDTMTIDASEERYMWMRATQIAVP